MSARILTKIRPASLLPILAILVSCTEGNDPDTVFENEQPSAKGAVIQVAPPQESVVAPGQTVQFNATVLDESGRPVPGVEVEWSSSDAGVARVDSYGRVTGIFEGVAWIRGRWRRDRRAPVTDSARIGVSDDEAARYGVQIVPTSDTISYVGGRVSLVAAVYTESGRPVHGRKIQWQSLDPSIVKVDDGVVLGSKSGEGRVVARSGESADTATIMVAPSAGKKASKVEIDPASVTLDSPGKVATLSARVLDSSNQPVKNQSVSWGSMSPQVAVVDASGRVTAVGKGQAVIMARQGNLAGYASVIVNGGTTAPQIASIDIQPATASVKQGQSVRLGAVVYDDSGKLFSNQAVTWTSLNASIAIVDPSGNVSGVAAGTARIVARASGIADTAVVTVTSSGGSGGGGGNGGGTKTPAPVTLDVTMTVADTGSEHRIRVDSKADTAGIGLTGESVVYEIKDSKSWLTPNKKTKISRNLLSGGVDDVVWYVPRGTKASMTVTVRGEVKTLEYEASGVAAPAVGSVEITPTADTIPNVGEKTQLTVEVRDSSGSRSSTKPVWSSLDPSVVVVSSSGVVTGAAKGMGRVVAKGEGAADTAYVWVAPSTGSTGGGGGGGGGNGGSSATPSDLVAVVGPLVSRSKSATEPLRTFDEHFASQEVARYDAWVATGRNVNETVGNAMHYGSLRSRYQWSVRNGLPVGPGAPSNSPYARGREMLKRYLVDYSKANGHKTPPHGNTGMADVELLYVLEGDADALAHLKGVAYYYGALYIEDYFDLSGADSDPRSSAVLLQTMSAAHRLGLPYTARGSWGSSWRQAASYIVNRIQANIPSSGKVVSKAHQRTGQGDESYFMNAMLATELLRWHGFIEPQPSWVDLARRIVDHLMAEDARISGACLPYTSNDSGCATDLAAFYVWPALVLWQETGDVRYRNWAEDNMKAAHGAFVYGTKQFNQTYGTGAQSYEALLSGMSWH